LSKDKQVKVEAVPQAVREIAWKAQSRLNQRYGALLRRGKLKNIAITAMASEFVGFMWAVAQAVGAAPAAANIKRECRVLRQQEKVAAMRMAV
jgi:hypothetical protein